MYFETSYDAETVSIIKSKLHMNMTAIHYDNHYIIQKKNRIANNK